jgi:hypothetical protein
MGYVPCRERTFLLELSYDFEYYYVYYVHWLKHFLERLGRELTLDLWNQAFEDYDETLLLEILSVGWQEAAEGRSEEAEVQISSDLDRLFPLPVQGVSREEARELVENTPPFRQIRQRFSTLDWQREITTFEALHLFYDGLALLAETLIERLGKQGEFIAYDATLEQWTKRQRRTQEVEEFMAGRLARYGSPPEEPDMFSAGLEVELVRSSAQEVVTRVTECEWARYYRERHPGVGYMLACSADNAAYESFNDRIRLQRTHTLMEGGAECDFRVYAFEVPDRERPASPSALL